MSDLSLVRKRQAPLVRRYRQDPQAAIIHKQARTVPEEGCDPFHVAVTVDGPYPPTLWWLGVDDKVGGHSDLPNPAELLLAALAGCHESTMRVVADHLGVEIHSLEVVAHGEVDARGCLAMDPSVRVGFQSIELSVRLQVADGTDPQRLERLKASADRLCVTGDTLRSGVSVDITYATPQVAQETRGG